MYSTQITLIDAICKIARLFDNLEEVLGKRAVSKPFYFCPGVEHIEENAAIVRQQVACVKLLILKIYPSSINTNIVHVTSEGSITEENINLAVTSANSNVRQVQV